ncbi:hypothetical protein D9757_012439 [Collybiopsis confluens]|uniref:Uncharacterized protein n=1 Tax=Collybiopsis confluens TaxID=2823264 RepID=A0A8H5FUS2_9AGAR|nr:hypothetical protein D9757_012439 [Collybiopsis confluens]
MDEMFKLHIKPPQHGYPLPPLPQKKTAVDVFADFLKYLVKDCAEKFISESYPGGSSSPLHCDHCDREYVVSHPNGWEGTEQQMLRQACVQALLMETFGSKNLHLVTDGESSLPFCLSAIPNLVDFAAPGRTVLVVDAGGGTVDFSAYSRAADTTNYHEAATPRCEFAGSVFVSRKAETYFTG